MMLLEFKGYPIIGNTNHLIYNTDEFIVLELVLGLFNCTYAAL